MNAEMNIRPLTDADQVSHAVPGKWKGLIQQVIREGPLVVENPPEHFRAKIRQAALAQGMKSHIRTLTDKTGFAVSVEPMKDTSHRVMEI